MKLTRGRDEMAAAAISQMSAQGGGHQAVGDGVGAAAIGGYSAPSKGNIGSGLELLSDPEGVDFRPYLLQILNSVRRNWFAVIPESARLGLEKGRVALQFSISRQGDVPKLVISSSARSQPLDRASVAGVSASLPFPPLPADFKGDEIRVQFVFLYNVKP
jgi:TonB family protein